jgi:hypothetical protein
MDMIPASSRRIGFIRRQPLAKVAAHYGATPSGWLMRDLLSHKSCANAVRPRCAVEMANAEYNATRACPRRPPDAPPFPARTGEVRVTGLIDGGERGTLDVKHPDCRNLLWAIEL